MFRGFRLRGLGFRVYIGAHVGKACCKDKGMEQPGQKKRQTTSSL